MLRKLLKYEIKAMSRKFFPLYGALLVISAFVNFGLRNPKFDFLAKLSILLLVALFIALIVFTLITMIQRFKNNLLSNEGYLMFTLPVSTERLILSKLITALFFAFLSCAASLLSFFIIALNADTMEAIRDLFVRYSYYINLVQKEYIVAVILGAACIVSQFVYFVLIVYCSLSVSQMSVFTKRRGAVSFMAFIVITVVFNMLAGELFTGLFPSMHVFDVEGLNSMLITALLFNTSLSVIMFFASDYLLKKHLNLE